MKFLKIIKKLFILLVVTIFIVFVLSRGKIFKKEDLEYGVTFSAKQAEALSLNWRQTFLAILEDLGARKIRLPAYWDEIESSNGAYSWENLDWQINEATRHNADLIIAVGGRLPRWPECHFPSWAENLSQTDREQRILDYIEGTINRYKDNQTIKYWQVENEPFLTHFGECPNLDPKFLDKEIALVKSLDNRSVIITDSGELSTWVPAARRADIFGTTMYRDTYSQFLKRYIHYPITPGFFRLKKNLVRIFAQPKEWIVIELQGEPWGPIPYQTMSDAEKAKTMDRKKFQEIIDFSSQTGFKTFYLWGAEWWYWEKTVKNNSGMWEEARGLFQ
jgi:hypothetical protein